MTDGGNMENTGTGGHEPSCWKLWVVVIGAGLVAAGVSCLFILKAEQGASWTRTGIVVTIIGAAVSIMVAALLAWGQWLFAKEYAARGEAFNRDVARRQEAFNESVTRRFEALQQTTDKAVERFQVVTDHFLAAR